MEQYPGGTYIISHSSITNSANSYGSELTVEDLLEAKKQLEKLSKFNTWPAITAPSWHIMICQVCSDPIHSSRDNATRTTTYHHLGGEVTVRDESAIYGTYNVQAWARGVHEYQEADGQEG